MTQERAKAFHGKNIEPVRRSRHRRYAARSHGFLARRRWIKCAQPDCMATPAVSFSPLRRELSRSHEYRLRAHHAPNEDRPRSDRFGLWHGERDFFYRLFRATDSRGAVG